MATLRTGDIILIPDDDIEKPDKMSPAKIVDSCLRARDNVIRGVDGPLEVASVL